MGGFRDRLEAAAERGRGTGERLQQAQAERQVPAAGDRYDVEVNTGSVNMRRLAGHLNDRARAGWQLHTALEQDGNLVLIWEAV